MAIVLTRQHADFTRMIWVSLTLQKDLLWMNVTVTISSIWFLLDHMNLDNTWNLSNATDIISIHGAFYINMVQL